MKDFMCVDLTGSSPLMQIGMADFVPDRAIIDVAQRKSGKYMDKYAAIGYGFLLFPFSSLGELEPDADMSFFSFLSSLGELEADAVTLLKWIQKFSMTQDIEARALVHVFNMISFAIAKKCGPDSISTSF
nr:hypothetical protein [Tanacetum cinerariifolium]